MDIETLNIIAKSLGFFVRDVSHKGEVDICLFHLQDAVVRNCTSDDDGTDYDYARVVEEMATMFEDRKLVCDTLHASTCSMSSEDRPMQDRCWEAADGFGKKTLEELKEMDFDWSHIRDSSADAFNDMAMIILRHRLAMSTKRSRERTKAREMEAAAFKRAQKRVGEGGAEGLGEENCAEYYAAVHATNEEGTKVTLDRETFEAFRELGGTTHRSPKVRPA